jgi:hypothetical protein
MHAALYVAVALATFTTAAAGDYLEAKFGRAVARDDGEAAVRLSIGMYLVSLVGLVCFVKVGMWVAAFEVAGLYVGTRLAFRRKRVT